MFSIFLGKVLQLIIYIGLILQQSIFSSIIAIIPITQLQDVLRRVLCEYADASFFVIFEYLVRLEDAVFFENVLHIFIRYDDR